MPLAVVKYWFVLPSAISSDVLVPSLVSKELLALAVVKNKLVLPSATSSLLIAPTSNLLLADTHLSACVFCTPEISTSLNVPILELLKCFTKCWPNFYQTNKIQKYGHYTA